MISRYICFRSTITMLAALALCVSISPARAADPKVQRAAVPDGGIHPQVQTDSRGRVHLIFFKGEPRHGDIFYARSDDGGASFTSPLRVNSHPDTAYARSEDRTRSMLAGFQMHVAKPVEPAELIAAVASLAGRTSAPLG